MHESIDLTVSRAGIKLCIRKNTSQYSLQANLGSKSSSTEDGQNQQYEQTPSSVSYESHGDELVLSTSKPVYQKKLTHEYKDNNKNQGKSKYQQIVNLHKTNTNAIRNTPNSHYNSFNSSKNTVRIYLKDRPQNNSSVDYTSGSEKSLTSSDYDADDEDIEINSKTLSNCERKCMSRLCDLLRKNDDINLEGRNANLQTFIESIFLDDQYNDVGEGDTPQRDFHLSKEKLDKLLQKMCRTKHNEVRRQKRESNTSPQLALLIPMIHEDVNENEDTSKKFKRCIRKSCRKSVCQNLGCYTNKGSYEAISPEVSYETNYREITANKKMPYIHSYDSTLHSGSSYPENYLNKAPIHHLKFESRQNMGRNHKENDISRKKISKFLLHHQERKNEDSEELQDKSSLYDDLKDNESSASLQTRLEGTAHYLKKLLEESRGRSRNQKKPQHWNDQHQMTYFPHETTNKNFDSLSQKMDRRKFVENKADEYLSLPKSNKQMQSLAIPNQHQVNQFNSKTKNEHLSSATQTDSPSVLKQEHEFTNLQSRAETELNPIFSEVGNNVHSFIHSSNSETQKPNLSSEDGYSSNKNSHSNTRQVQEKMVEDNPQMKDNTLTTRDSSTFHYLDSIDNVEHQFPVKLNNSSISKTHKYSVPSITGPRQSAWESTIGENSDILQQVNLQEIYKNLPPNYEFSAGQWIRVQPSEGIHMQSGKFKSTDKGENDRGTNDFEGYDYNSMYSQQYNQSEDNAKVVITKNSDPSDQLISPEKLKNGAGNYQEKITNVAEQDLDIYRSQGNRDSTELKSQYEHSKKDGSNIKTDLYSTQDKANPKSRYLTDQLIVPVSLTANVEANENMHQVPPDFTTEKESSSLTTPYAKSQQEKPVTSNMEKKWETNDQFYRPPYQNNMQYHENKNDITTTNIHLLNDKSYLNEVTETKNNENEEKIINPFEDNEELTTSFRTSNLYNNDGTNISDIKFPSPLMDVTKPTVSQTTYSIPPNESELQRNVLHIPSKETSNTETVLPKSQENIDTKIEKIHSEHASTNEYSKKQYNTSPRVSGTQEDLQIKKDHKKPTQEHGNKIPHSDTDFKKFVSESNLKHEQINKTSWNGTPRTVVHLLNKMLENPEQDANIENSTLYNSSEWAFTSATDEVPSLTEETSRDILQSGSEEIHRSNSREKEILDTSPEFRGETPFLQNVEGDRSNVFQNHHPMSPYHTNYPEPIDVEIDLPSHKEDTTMITNARDNMGHVFRPNIMTYDSKKSSIFENVAQKEKDNIFEHTINNLPQSFTLEAVPTKEDVSEQNEYSGTILIVDPSTGAVAETIPVTGRFLSLNSEKHGKTFHAGIPHPSLQTNAPTYLQPNSQEHYPSKSYNDKSFETKYPQEIYKGYTYFPPQIIQPTPHTTSTKNEWHKFEFPSKDNHSIVKEKMVNILPQKKGIDIPANSVLQSKYYPKQRNHIVEYLDNGSQSKPSMENNYESSSNVMDDSSQIKSDSQISLRIPSKVNVTCLVKDLQCETAKDDVYSNFFRVMLKEMQKLGEENCRTCSNSTLIPACENCIRNLIHERVSEHSINEEVKNYAVNHCPQLEATDYKKDTTEASTSPYTKCKYKFIADLTSLFGLWLKAITNSR